jgi:D-3-phosphoglycerate dehydrogenase
VKASVGFEAKKPFHVLITDRFDLEALALLKGAADLSVRQSTSPRPTDEELKDIDGLIIRSRTRVDREFLDRARAVKVIITATSGFDHIDLEATHDRGITVMFTPEANAQSAAELTWGLVMACTRRLNEAHRAVKSGDWRRETLTGRELRGKTFGIVGLGRIGTRVARFAKAFDMNTIAFDPYKDDQHFSQHGTTRVALDELLRLSDIASFHVPATPETKNMLHRGLLESANPGLILINSSRGSVVREKDLIEALDRAWISACGLDVFEKEPLSRQSSLLSNTQVILSPHLGATTHEAFQAASREAAIKLLRFVREGDSSDRLPPEEEWYVSGFVKKFSTESDSNSSGPARE